MSGPVATKILESLPETGADWCVDRAESERIAGALGRRHYSVKGGGTSYPEVLIGFTSEAADTWEVHNVVPTQVGEISVEQYNRALLDFYDAHIRPHEGTPGLTAAPPRGEHDLSEYMGEEGVRLLEWFSGAANMSTGSSHPMDFRRWLDFVVYCHMKKVSVPGDLFVSALVDDMEWPDDTASELFGQYETFREVLERYDELRQA
jgi:hypothetical protein